MICSDQFVPACGCRSAGECAHGSFAEREALSAMVDAFATRMKEKLLRQQAKGYHGWDDRRYAGAIRKSLKRHVAKGDMVDVANLAAMLWNFEQQ